MASRSPAASWLSLWRRPTSAWRRALPSITSRWRPIRLSTLSPSSGVAGTIVAVNGSGFPANVNVGVYLAALDASINTGEPVRYAAGRTDGNGRASLSITMPSNWPNGAPISQDKVVVTLARTDFSVSASAVFNYLSAGPTWTPTTTPPPATATPAPNPSANLNPRTGGAGTVVTVVRQWLPG